jgi:hypothetical protein
LRRRFAAVRTSRRFIRRSFHLPEIDSAQWLKSTRSLHQPSDAILFDP